ncbi:MAG: hypothetical protein ACRDZO_12245 [Egibacteraceae bacterium]
MRRLELRFRHPLGLHPQALAGVAGQRQVLAGQAARDGSHRADLPGQVGVEGEVVQQTIGVVGKPAWEWWVFCLHLRAPLVWSLVNEDSSPGGLGDPAVDAQGQHRVGTQPCLCGRGHKPSVSR